VKRYLYGTLTGDKLAYLIHQAHAIAIYDLGSTVALWNWDDGVAEVEGKQVVPLEVEVESERELAKLKALILKLKKC